MNTLDYRRAMEQLSPDPALEEKIRSRLAQPYRPRLHPRRTAGRVRIAAAAEKSLKEGRPVKLSEIEA